MNAQFRLSCLILSFLVVSCSSAPQLMPAVEAGAGPTAALPVACSGEQSAAVQAMETGVTAALAALDAEKLVSYYTDDLGYEDPAYGDYITSKEGLLSMYRGMFALPGIKFETTSLFISADCTRAAGEWIWSGTKGGEPYSVRGVVIDQIRDGKVSRQTVYYASFSKPY